MGFNLEQESCEQESCAIEEPLYHALKVPGFVGKKIKFACSSWHFIKSPKLREWNEVYTTSGKDLYCTVLDHYSNIKRISSTKPTAVEVFKVFEVFEGCIWKQMFALLNFCISHFIAVLWSSITVSMHNMQTFLLEQATYSGFGYHY